MLVQALTALLDQLLLSTSAGGDAVELWLQLCHSSLPDPLPPMFTIHQAQSLQRYWELRGCGYGYLSAWCLATSAWLHHGLHQDPCNPHAWRALRRLVYERGGEVRLQLGPWLSELAGDAAQVQAGGSVDSDGAAAAGAGGKGMVAWGPGVVIASRHEHLAVCTGHAH